MHGPVSVRVCGPVAGRARGPVGGRVRGRGGRNLFPQGRGEVSIFVFYILANICAVATVISISMSDSEDEYQNAIVISTDEDEELQRVPAAASANTSRQMPPESPPPAYYSPPNITTFDFSPTVEAFLREIDVGPRALCRIDAIRNFESAGWKTAFLDAGLSDSQAIHLEQLFIEGLTTEQGFVLLAALDEV